jgi:hypothetical protein
MAGRLLAATVAAAAAGAVGGAPLTAGSLLAVRLGDGTTALSDASAPVFLDEVNPSTGALVQSIALGSGVSLPGATSVPALTTYQAGAPHSVGLLTRSTDASFASLAVWAYPPGSAWATGAPAWSLVAVDSSGVVTTPVPAIAGHYDGDVFTSAVAANASSGFYFANTGTSSGTTSGYAVGWAPPGYSSTAAFPAASSAGSSANIMPYGGGK